MHRDARTPNWDGPGRLRVAHEAIALSGLTRDFTRGRVWLENAHLRRQLRESCDSVYANIVEGNARTSRRDTRHFLTMAWSSLREYESHLSAASQARLLPESRTAELRKRARWVGRLLAGLRRHYDHD